MEKKQKKCHFGKDVSAEIRAIFACASGTVPQFCLSQVELSWLGADEAALFQVAGEVLSAAEMATFQSFRFPRRQREWLAGRLAVKEAVCTLLAEPQWPLRDVEVGVDHRGKPYWAAEPATAKPVHIAISHSGASALGLASHASCALDFQEIRSSLARVEAKFVRGDEQGVVQLCHADRLPGLGLLWAGKEALRKHLALWPLLGFLEAALVGVKAQGDGLLLTFEARQGKRELPATLPGVLATLYGDSALAIILADSGELAR